MGRIHSTISESEISIAPTYRKGERGRGEEIRRSSEREHQKVSASVLEREGTWILRTSHTREGTSRAIETKSRKVRAYFFPNQSAPRRAAREYRSSLGTVADFCNGLSPEERCRVYLYTVADVYLYARPGA